jgi:hypothetical protein
MSGRWKALLASSLLFVIAGCGGSKNDQVAEEEAPSGPPILADLLKQPRADIAKRADDLLTEVRTREQARRRGALKLTLLPTWWQPLLTPGLNDLNLNAELGLSLPPYADPKSVVGDIDLALQYARFGDVEAALKIAGGQAKAEIEAFKLEQNFPIEWSRLAAIHLHGLQQRLAAGETQALTELIDVHSELLKLLGEKGKTTPLGRDLLTRGRQTVAAAASAWKAAESTELAHAAEAALKEWPDDPPALPLAGAKATWAKAFKSTAEGPLLVAAAPLRALDFLQLPVPREGVEGVLLFFDEKDQLQDLLVTFSPNVRREAEQAAEVAAGFNLFATPTIAGKNGPVNHQWSAGKTETCLCPVNETFGGWVSLAVKQDTAARPVPRHLAQAHLDRRFDTNRLALAPQVLVDPVNISEEAGLVRLENPLPAAKLLRVDFNRVEGHDLLQEIAYRVQSGKPLREVAGPLFARLGFGKLNNEFDRTRTYLTVTWEDATTQLVLRLPDDAQQPTELTLRDRRDAAKAAERVATVTAFEKTERQQRLAAHKPLQRLPRKLEQFPLGMLKSEVLKFLPQGKGILRRDIGDTVLVALNVPTPERAYLIRQVIVRFDPENKVNWVRVRYEAGSHGHRQPNWPQTLLAPWRSQAGAVSTLPSPYLPREADLPPQAPAGQFFHWRDDQTEATCLLDKNGVEVTLWNRPPGDEPSAPYVYLPRGPETLRLGMTISEVKVALGEAESVPDGGLVFRPVKGPFDAIVVWTDTAEPGRIASEPSRTGEPSRVSDRVLGDRVLKIAARYRTGPMAKTTPADLEKALATQWASELAVINWPQRRDFLANTLQALTWFDDHTRYRLYWAESDNSPARLWSEWREEKGTDAASGSAKSVLHR